MRVHLSARTVAALACFTLGVATAMTFLQPPEARAVRADGFVGLEGCFEPRKHLALRPAGSGKIEVEIVALELVAVDPLAPETTFPVTVVPSGSVVPGAGPPDGSLDTRKGPFDLFFDLSLTQDAGIFAPFCNCMGNLCRGLGCPSGAGLCKKRSDCLE